MRLVQAGAIPINWLAVGSEIMHGWVDQPKAPAYAEVIYQHLPSWKHLNNHTTSIKKFAAQ